MKEVLIYKKLKDKIIQCRTCSHYCIIPSNERGFCNVRENKNGNLYSLVYGKAIAENIDPIEKKPFYHFMPGSHSLSIATIGCNFCCLHCQNWQISQINKSNESTNILGENLSPKKIIENALKNKGTVKIIVSGFL